MAGMMLDRAQKGCSRMKITDVQVVCVDMPFVEGFKVSYGVETASHHVFVRVVTDAGIVGLGDAAPLTIFTGETQQSAFDVISRMFKPLLVGQDPFDMERLLDSLNVIPGNPAAKSAVDQALHDVVGKALNQPVYSLLGGKYRGLRISVGTGLGIKEPAQMARDAARLVEAGFTTIKMKVGVDPVEDIKRVRAVREAIGSTVNLRVDANAGYDLKSAVKVARGIENCSPEHLEQPLPANALDDMAELRKISAVPIMADESVWSPLDALRIVEKKAADVIAIKFSKCGGIRNAIRIAHIAEAAGIPCFLISAFESGIGLAANAHVAVATRNISRTCELGLWTIQEDPFTRGLRAGGGYIDVTNEPGLGVECVVDWPGLRDRGGM